jgi:hypothetical protein
MPDPRDEWIAYGVVLEVALHQPADRAVPCRGWGAWRHAGDPLIDVQPASDGPQHERTALRRAYEHALHRDAAGAAARADVDLPDRPRGARGGLPGARLGARVAPAAQAHPRHDRRGAGGAACWSRRRTRRPSSTRSVRSPSPMPLAAYMREAASGTAVDRPGGDGRRSIREAASGTAVDSAEPGMDRATPPGPTAGTSARRRLPVAPGGTADRHARWPGAIGRHRPQRSLAVAIEFRRTARAYPKRAAHQSSGVTV